MNIRKKTILSALLLTAGTVAFAAPPPPPPPPFLRNLPETERHELMELQRKNPAEFKKALRERLHKKRAAEINDALAMRNRYLNAATPEEKAAVKAELQKKITKKFDEHLKYAEQRITDNEARLRDMQERNKKFKQEVEQRKKNKDAMISKMVDDLLNPEKAPNFRHPGKKGKK